MGAKKLIETVKKNNNELCSLINKMSEYTITDNASGSQINLPYSTDLKLKHLTMYGKTTQGAKPSPESPQTLKSAASDGGVEIKVNGKNLIPFPYYDGARKELNGLTFTQNDDGGVTINGTATAKTTYTLLSDYSFVSNFISSGTYTISTGSDIASDRTVFVQAKIDYNNKANYVYFQDMGTIKSTTIPDYVTDAHITIVNLIVYAGYTAENITIYPMIEKGSEPTEFEPYVEQKVNLPTPTALPGVPVFTGYEGTDPIIPNYVDSNGQEWVCDELDLTNGLYYKRIAEYTVNISNIIRENGLWVACCDNFTHELANVNGGMWEYGKLSTFESTTDAFSVTKRTLNGQVDKPYVMIFNYDESTFNYTDEQIKQRYNGSKMLLIRKDPVVTELTEAQINSLKAWKTLQTNKPVTNITSDAFLDIAYTPLPGEYIENIIKEVEPPLEFE